MSFDISWPSESTSVSLITGPCISLGPACLASPGIWHVLLLRLTYPAGEIQLKLPPESLLFLPYRAAGGWGVGGEGVGLEGWAGRGPRVRRRVMFLSIYYVLGDSDRCFGVINYNSYTL